MKVTALVGGLFALIKDIIKFFIYLIKRPHYVAFLFFLFFGAFYLNGIPPRQVPLFFKEKWERLVLSRKEGYLNDFSLVSGKVKETFGTEEDEKRKEQEPLKQKTLKTSPASNPVFESKSFEPSSLPQEEPIHYEQQFVWNKAFEEERKPIQDSRSFVEGRLRVVSATKLNVGGQIFDLNLRLISGRAGDAYSDMTKKFEGLTTRCYFDSQEDLKEDAKIVLKADCYADNINLSEFLIDYGYAQRP